eukprot:scaffold2664_cov267-Pinguiococcus_pyrenoidosus.AAC.7
MASAVRHAARGPRLGIQRGRAEGRREVRAEALRPVQIQTERREVRPKREDRKIGVLHPDHVEEPHQAVGLGGLVAGNWLRGGVSARKHGTCIGAAPPIDHARCAGLGTRHGPAIHTRRTRHGL